MRANMKIKLAVAASLLIATAPSYANERSRQIAQQCPAFATAASELKSARTQIRISQAAILDRKQQGPEVFDFKAKLDLLTREKPAEIEKDRTRFLADMQRKTNDVKVQQDTAIAKLRRQRDELRSRNETRLAALQIKYDGLIANEPDRDKLLADANAKLQQAKNERRIVMAELRTGKFCSECSRSKYEIEKQTNVDFDTHLRDVNGYAVMREDKLLERERRFDSQIASAQNGIDRAHKKISDYDKDTQETLDEMTNLKVGGVEEVNSLDRRIVAQQEARYDALMKASNELEVGKQRYRKAETDRKNEVEDLRSRIDSRETSYRNEVAELQTALADAHSKERLASSTFFDARRSCRKIIAQNEKANAQEEIDKRAKGLQGKRRWAQASYNDTLGLERARRSALDSGAPMPQFRPSAQLQKLQQAAMPRSNVASSPGNWRDVLDPRQTSFYRSLNSQTQAKINETIETLSDSRKVGRATLRDSLGRFKREGTLATLKNVFGQGRGLAPDLYEAVEKSRPNLYRTINRAVMPTVKAVAMEVALDAQESALDREYDPQERVVERSRLRVIMNFFNPKQLGDEMIETYRETLDNFSLRSNFED